MANLCCHNEFEFVLMCNFCSAYCNFAIVIQKTGQLNSEGILATQQQKRHRVWKGFGFRIHGIEYTNTHTNAHTHTDKNDGKRSSFKLYNKLHCQNDQGKSQMVLFSGRWTHSLFSILSLP